MRKQLARMLIAIAVGAALTPGSSSAQGKSQHPPGAAIAQSRRPAKGHFAPPPHSHRGGRGFDRRVVRALHKFDNHPSLDPPRCPRSP